MSKRQKKDVTIMALTYIQKTVHPAPITLHESNGVAYFTFPLLEQTRMVHHAFLPGLAERARDISVR